MSRINVSELSHASNGGDPNIELYADGSTSLRNFKAESINNSQISGSRNMVINADFAVAQRGTKTENIGNSNFGWIADRMRFYNNTNAVCTVTHKKGGGPPGHHHWGELSVQTADTDIGADQYGVLQHKIEGYSFARACFGTPQAKQLAISFWFKSSTVGEYAATFRNNNGTRTWCHPFNVTTADTWQKIEYTVDPCTDGTWNYENAIGAGVEIFPANGTDYQTSTTDAWISGQYFHASPNNVNFFATTGTLGWTALQVEVGNTPTDFEYEDVQVQLARCQRYYESGSSKLYVGVAGGNGCAIAQCFKVTKRAVPTMNYSTAGARQYVPSITEWIDNDSFGAQYQGQSEIAFVFGAEAEL